MNKDPYRNYDLPVKHLYRGFDYIPPKARSAEEIERRRSLPTGTLLAEYQTKGIQVARKMIELTALSEQPDDFTASTLAAAEFNTSWYNHASAAQNVMRRRLYLPRFDEDIEDLSEVTLLEEAALDLDVSESLADLLKLSIEGRHCSVPSFRKRLGIALGNASLRLAVSGSVDLLRRNGDDYFAVQAFARALALRITEASREMFQEVGANPSLAQLADRDSPFSVFIRRKGTNQAVSSFEEATAVL